jgi:hypothetical protein
MTALIFVVSDLVLLEWTQFLPSNCYCAVFSANSYTYYPRVELVISLVQEFVFSVVSLLRIELIEEITAHQLLFNLGFSVMYIFNAQSYVLWT